MSDANLIKFRCILASILLGNLSPKNGCNVSIKAIIRLLVIDYLNRV